MKKYISWDDLPESVGVFYGVAADLEPNYYVIFSMGSIVKILSAAEKFTGYTPEHMETWPIWRLDKSISADEVYHDLTAVWKEQSALCDCTVSVGADSVGAVGMRNVDGTNGIGAKHKNNCLGSIIAYGYGALFAQSVQPVITRIEIGEDDPWCIVSYNGGLHVIPAGETSDDDIDFAVMSREYDLLFPQVYAVITPDMELIVIIDEKNTY